MSARSRSMPAAIAAVSSVLLILSMLLDWYKLDLPSEIGQRQIDVPTYNAFEGLERADVALVVAAVLALVLACALLARVLADSPWPALGLLAVGLFALAVVIYRGSSRPIRPFFDGDIETTLEYGWYVSLAAAALIALGGLLAYLAGPRLQLEEGVFEEGEEPHAAPRDERG
jgi:hypothetical protein